MRASSIVDDDDAFRNMEELKRDVRKFQENPEKS